MRENAGAKKLRERGREKERPPAPSPGERKKEPLNPKPLRHPSVALDAEAAAFIVKFILPDPKAARRVCEASMVHNMTNDTVL